MSQQWPPQSNPPAPEPFPAPSASSGPGQSPAVDDAPTAPMGVVTPDASPVPPMGGIPAHAPQPVQPSPWQIIEQSPRSAPPSPVSPASTMRAERRSMTPLIVGLVVLLVLGGGGAIFALTRGGLGGAQASTTPNANGAFTKFTDANGTYSLNVPTAWLTTGNAALTTFGPAAQPGLRMEVERLEVQLNGQPDDVASSFFDTAASSSNGSVANKSGPTSVTLAGTTWSQYTGDLTAGSTTEHIVLLVAGHTTNTVVLATIAPDTSFSSADSQYFQPMLKSFAFLK